MTRRHLHLRAAHGVRHILQAAARDLLLWQ